MLEYVLVSCLHQFHTKYRGTWPFLNCRADSNHYRQMELVHNVLSVVGWCIECMHTD